MPRHAMNLDTMGPGSDNDANRGKPDLVKKGKGSAVHKVKDGHKTKKHSGGHKMAAGGGGDAYQGPQASSMPGQLSIIHDVMRAGRGITGIPGIISSTTTSPETRSRLMAGIIESPFSKPAAEGPVSRVQGVDATAYNTGMVHLPGSRFH